MIVDVRRNVSLGVPADRAKLVVQNPKPLPGTAFPTRRLTLRGTPVFELALWCGTCPAMFTKLAEPETADLELANGLLNAGLERINDQVLQVYGKVLPASEYTVLLLEVTPRLVKPGSPPDYFTHEQVHTWGVDPTAGFPEDPGTPAYRTFAAPATRGGHLYEFVVPMVPPAWNNSDRVAQYATDTTAEFPTAVAYSLLDVLQPAMDDGEDYYEHWVLSHFLIDGHHKMQAAATAGGPIRLLALVDERTSLATTEDLATMTRIRSQPQQSRTRYC